jgi:hypothetical protein
VVSRSVSTKNIIAKYLVATQVARERPVNAAMANSYIEVAKDGLAKKPTSKLAKKRK